MSKANSEANSELPTDAIRECIANFFDDYENTDAYKQLQGLLDAFTKAQVNVTFWHELSDKQKVANEKLHARIAELEHKLFNANVAEVTANKVIDKLLGVKT